MSLINEQDWKVIEGEVTAGHRGTLGVRVQIAGTMLTATQGEKVREIAYSAMTDIKEELTAEFWAADPKAQQTRQMQRLELLRCFPTPIWVEELPNGYCNRGCCRHLPWFRVTTTVGIFVIGWCKRVINIDWEGVPGAGTSRALFAAENVTKGEYSIHAWGVGDAARYVQVIIASVNPQRQKP
jgi:hypothetical protein